MARKGKRPEEGQYVPLPYSLLKSPAWRSLSGAAIKVFLELHTRFNGGNNGKIHMSMNEAADVLGLGKATVQRAFVELQEKGFIALTASGSWYHRKAHDWRLTTKPMHTVVGKQVAINDWRSWQPAKTKRGSESDPSLSQMVPSRNPGNGIGSKPEPVSGKPVNGFGSGMEH
ncbi:hypothetical protein DEA8626_03453 [Defluviimonas aquaemixtae]|uniref:Helix-turn-helix domain-containing protein n=1 Tax=Albidovulum aquaemixtae TaxID=1542388 RepID=A0A2R8BM81_9RHOB|nr:helix-turn-helix domain-containing protein [Defluviimonas aquaemixtae]SPH24401.1 hypothetical protein DEA8626_03453 [Defluviimonas aquaemixtae]